MLIINDKYAIKNDGLCYAVCEFEIIKKTGEGYFRPKWYLNTLAQAVCFLADRSIDIPETLQGLSDNIETFKNDIVRALKGSHLDLRLATRGQET